MILYDDIQDGVGITRIGCQLWIVVHNHCYVSNQLTLSPIYIEHSLLDDFGWSCDDTPPQSTHLLDIDLLPTFSLEHLCEYHLEDYMFLLSHVA